MHRRPSSCRVCGAESVPDAVVSWRGLCPDCGPVQLLTAERLLATPGSAPWRDAHTRCKEGVRLYHAKLSETVIWD